MAKRKKDLQDALTPPDEVETGARLNASLAETKLLRRELHEVSRTLGAALDIRDLLRDATQAMTPPPIWRASKPRGKPSVTALVLFGDAHIGERTDPKQTEEFGRYNYAIAERRTREYLHCLTKWLATQRAGYRIDRCAVVCLGDMISGDIHEELMRSNEFPPPLQAIAAGRLLAGLVSGLASQFKGVDVYGVGGSNHGRLTKKYQFKGGTLNSWDYVVYEHARVLLRTHRNVAVDILTAKKQTVQIAGYGFLCGHGDHVRAWMGIPWYGIERDMMREARRRLDSVMEKLRKELPVEGPMDYGLGGHWHVPFVGPGFRFIVNGSLSGTNEYDHSAARHCGPQQVAALVSPKHGLFGPVAWHLDTAAETSLLAIDSRTRVFSGAEVVL